MIKLLCLQLTINAPLFIRLFSGLKLLLIVFQSFQDDCWMIINDSVQPGTAYVRDLNIASSEYRPDDIVMRPWDG